MVREDPAHTARVREDPQPNSQGQGDPQPNSQGQRRPTPTQSGSEKTHTVRMKFQLPHIWQGSPQGQFQLLLYKLCISLNGSVLVVFIVNNSTQTSNSS